MIAAAWALGLLVVAGPFDRPGPEVQIVTELEPAEAERWRAACAEVGARLEVRGRWLVPVRRAKSVADFAARTGRARFEAAAVVGEAIWLQPTQIFERIPAADAVRRHECAHLALRHAKVPPLPAALEEAVAAGVSRQAARLPAGRTLDAGGLEQASRTLARPKTRADLQSALQDVVTTLWPRLRALRGPRLVERLRAAAAARDWVSALPKGS